MEKRKRSSNWSWETEHATVDKIEKMTEIRMDHDRELRKIPKRNGFRILLKI